MPEPTLKLGCLPSDPDFPRVFLSRYTTNKLPAPPTSASYLEKIAKWPMMLNDRWGDCVVAAKGHLGQVLTCYGSDKEIVVPDAAIQTDYFTESGGRDSGLNIPESLDYWVKHGLGGIKISAWASVHPKDPVEMSQAISWFGGCYYGLAMPNNFMSYFSAGRAWDNTSQAPNQVNGHAVVGVAYNEKGPIVITWGKPQQCSWAWIQKYATDADVIISLDWNSKVITPGSLDLASLLGDFEALTGKKPPVPENPPIIDWLV